MTSGARNPGRSSGVWLVIVAAAVAGGAAGLAPAPGTEGTDAATTSTFAALASAAIVALSTFPFIARRSVRGRAMSIALAATALLLGLISFSVGGYTQRACTAPYAGKAVVIGTDLTMLGLTYSRANPELSSEELLFDSAGVADRVWTRESIRRCRVFIGSTYFLWIPFLVVCVLAAVKAMPALTLAVPAARGPAPSGVPAPAGAVVPVRYDVFVSYRHGGQDSAFATQLLVALETSGYAVAIDERDFPANASFLQEMERCIRESRFTVAVISSRYLESGNCAEEAIICKVLDMGDRQRRLIPMIIAPVSMPVWLYGIVGIDCTRPDPLVDPFDKLKATLGAPLSQMASPLEA
jgi:hypothetical protein